MTQIYQYKIVYRPLEERRITRIAKAFISSFGLDPNDDVLYDDQVKGIYYNLNDDVGPGWIPYGKKVKAFYEALVFSLKTRFSFKKLDEEALIKKARELAEGCDATEYAYSTCYMPFHVGLVLDGKLFEYEDDDMFYNGFKDYDPIYNKKILWKDFCPESKSLDISGETLISPKELDEYLKKNTNFSTKGHYKLKTHNCQHFTHYAVDFIKLEE